MEPAETLPSASCSSTEAEFATHSAASDGDDSEDLESKENHDKSSSESVASILTQLRCPPASRLARKRKIKTNRPASLFYFVPIAGILEKGKKGEVDMLLQTPKV